MTFRRVERDDYPAWSAEDAGQASAISPQQIAGFVRRRGWLVAAVTALCLLGGLLFHLTSVPRYVSTAQIIIDPRELQNVSNGAAPRNENADSTEAMVENEMRVLKSNMLLSKLIDSEDLTHDSEFVHEPFHLIAGLRGMLGDPSEKATDTSDAKVGVLQQLDRLIAVRRTERSFVIDITVTTANPDKSARLANRLVELYIAQASATRADLNRRAGTALEDRLSELQARVRQADEKVEQFREENNLVSAAGVLTSDQNLRDLNNQLVLAQTRQDEDRAKLDQIQHLRGSGTIDTVPEAVQSQSVIQLRTQIAEAVRRRAALAKQLGPRHPDYIAADNEVQTLQRLVAQELQRVAQAAHNQYGRSKQNEAALQTSVSAMSRSSLQTSRASVRLRELERDADAARALFTSFLSRSQELAEQTQVYTNNVRQISAALPALQRANLPASVVLLVALVLGLGLGTALGALLEFRSGLWAGRPWRTA